MYPISMPSYTLTLEGEILPLQGPTIDMTHLLTKKISKVEAGQIEFIGLRIADNIFNNLGCKAKLRVVMKCIQKKEGEMTPQEEATMPLLFMWAAQEGGNFPPEEDRLRFNMGMLWPIKATITEEFSTPAKFLDTGIVFSLSKYEPEGILAETLDKMGIKLDLTQFPLRYEVKLQIDTALSQKQHKLVFALTHTSDGIEFDQETFSLDELAQQFRQ